MSWLSNLLKKKAGVPEVNVRNEAGKFPGGAELIVQLEGKAQYEIDRAVDALPKELFTRLYVSVARRNRRESE